MWFIGGMCFGVIVTLGLAALVGASHDPIDWGDNTLIDMEQESP